MNLRLVIALAISLFFASSAVVAQKPTGGSTGSNGPGQPSFNNPNGMNNIPQSADLQVRISWPNERRLEESVHIQLLNAQGIPVQDTFSNRDGMVSFRNVTPGSYRLKLDGSDIKDTSTDAFVIYPQERMHMEWVHVAPKETANNNPIPGAAPTVSASQLNVPPKAKSEMDKGMDAFTKGDLKKADEKLQKAVEIYPKYAMAWNNLGVVRMREKDTDGAKSAWLKCIEADDKFPSGYLNLARVSMMEKNLPEAESYIKKSLITDPNNSEALVLLAKEQLLSGSYDKALVTARKVHTLPQHLPDAHLVAGEALLHENRDSEAVQEYGLYLKEYPDSPNAAKVRNAMAQIQAKQQKPETN
jgi:Tfp pilus assembly protein PilF